MKIEAGMVAVVTGAGSGIGRALAEKAAQSGMRVVAADIEQPRLDDTVAAHRRVG
jgi:NAD(P)-dependent dehydrogenase (short-subunit alcohol dehydrogenase family)